MHIIHLGLPKTGTTWLQNQLYLNCEAQNIPFNPSDIINRIFIFMKFGLNDSDIKKLKNDIRNYKHLIISWEGLISLNPYNWEHDIKKLSLLFDKKSFFLLSLRPTVDFFKSVYQQYIQQSNIVRQEKFFLRDSVFSKICKEHPRSRFPNINVDKFNYSHLYELLNKKFSYVKIISFESVINCESLKLFNKTFKKYKLNKNSKNTSLSSHIIKITICRERILRYFGLKTIGTNDIPIYDYYEQLRRYRFPYERNIEEFRLTALLRILYYHLNFMKWDTFSKLTLAKILPHKEYKINETLLNQELIKSNDIFLNELTND